MCPRSVFVHDLNREKLLQPYLDTIYTKQLKAYSFTREHSFKEQHKGVDVVLTHRTTKRIFFVDEKAQLDYINEDLPTFAFEVHYSKDGVIKTGWLFDSNKKTQFYALVTSIYKECNEFTSCKLFFVNRSLLLEKLESLGITYESLTDRVNESNQQGRIILNNLSVKKEGYLFFSKNNKAEQPLNLILKLDWLLTIGVAKRFF